MDLTEERIRRLTDAIHSLAKGQFDTPFVFQGDCDALGDLERATIDLQAAMGKNSAESHSLATANVRVMLWNEALQKINHADSIVYHGGDIEVFFQRIVADAMEMTRARYGALAVFDKDGGLAEFIARGMEEENIRAIGRQPEGKGLLAAVFREQMPLRVDDIGADPRACGFPSGHPPMKSLLGVPMRIGGKLKGAIYLADKEKGELVDAADERQSDTFTDEDEVMVGLFCDYLVRALERIELMRMLKDSNRLLERQGEEQQHLIRKLKEAQSQLLQSEKLAAIGQLAAGVAHEINNPIGFVNSNLGTLKTYVEGLLGLIDAYEQCEAEKNIHSERLSEAKQAIDLDFLRQDIVALVGESRDGLDRVKKIVQDLRDFSHADETELQEADLNAGLESTLNVVWNELKYKADIVKNYGELPPVRCVPGQLNQVFMNLLVNAAQAIEPRGTIVVRTGRDGDEVWVEIADTGSGIAPENMKRIFDPFFTTKPVGKGTGLGLSLSYGIVQKHHGRIEVRSELGKGTAFRVALPIKQPMPVGEATPDHALQAATAE